MKKTLLILCLTSAICLSAEKGNPRDLFNISTPSSDSSVDWQERVIQSVQRKRAEGAMHQMETFEDQTTVDSNEDNITPRIQRFTPGALSEESTGTHYLDFNTRLTILEELVRINEISFQTQANCLRHEINFNRISINNICDSVEGFFIDFGKVLEAENINERRQGYIIVRETVRAALRDATKGYPYSSRR